MEKRVKKALEYYQKGYNSAQSVLCAYSDLLEVEEKTLLMISEAFGCETGDAMDTCGAVTGMYMAAGIKNGEGLPTGIVRSLTDTMVTELSEAFTSKNKALTCRELKGTQSGIPLRSCEGCIEDAVRIVGEKFFKLN
jgi:hypothetical protein